MERTPLFTSVIIISIIIIRGRQCKPGESDLHAVSLKTPAPQHLPTYRQKEEKRKNSKRQNGIEQYSRAVHISHTAYTQYCHRSNMNNVTLNTLPVRNRVSSFRRVSSLR